MVHLSKGLLVVDAGTPSSGQLLVRKITGAGLRPKWIAVTHAHFDHFGGAADLKAAFPEARLLCHPEDREGLAEGRMTVPKHIGALTGVRGLAIAWAGLLRPRPVAADGDLEELMELGVDPVDLPGHSFPHTGFRLPGGEILAGDSFVSLKRDRPMRNDFGESMPEMDRTLANLAAIAEADVHPSHGEPCSPASLRALVEGTRRLGGEG